MANQSATAEQILEKIRQRVRERKGSAAPAPVPGASAKSETGSDNDQGADLSQLRQEVAAANELHAAVGTINPRRGGPHNAAIQFSKKVMRRSLTWYTRPLHLFHGAVARSLNHLTGALERMQSSFARLQGSQEGLHKWVTSLNNGQQQLSQEVYARLGRLEHDFKTLQDERVIDRLKSNERDARRILHAMQPEIAGPKASTVSNGDSGEFDYFMFEERFRGAEADIRDRQKGYLNYFRGRENVIDLGCGRGEFLELLRDTGVPARGVESGIDAFLLCQEKGLDVKQANLFDFLAALPEKSLGGIFSAQVIEHLPVPLQFRMVELAYEKLAAGSPLVIETINPECVSALVRNYYLDPSHVRPVHPELLKFILQSKGFGRVELRFSAPLSDRQIPALRLEGNTPELQKFNDALQGVNDLLFGYQDYAAVAWR